jgi:hypothetical protein
MNRPSYCDSCGERQVEYGPEHRWGRSTYCPQCNTLEEEKEPKPSEKQKALDALLVATKLLVAAETKREADNRYEEVRGALLNYYNTVWTGENG